MHYLIVSAVLVVFWILLSGHFSALLLGLGALSVALVTLIVHRMDRIDGEPGVVFPGAGMLAYSAWLLGCVVRSNIDLARRIWNPALPVQISWERLDIGKLSSLEKTLYANSITLTPGTLTTDIHDNHFMIHSLFREGIEDLRGGEMENRIRRLGI